jgi:hypothetical protein
MRATWKYMVVAALVAVAAQDASAQVAAAAVRQPILLGTTGACNNLQPGGPCTQTSTLVQIDPRTGALIRTIGPVGYTINGLAWDRFTGKLYASTAIGDVSFHGLITVDPFSGQGTPVNPAATNFGLALPASPVHSVVISPLGDMVAWYDEKPAPGVTDTFVRINKHTGVANEFNNTGIDTNQNGVAFQPVGLLSILWNIDGPKTQPDGTVTQNAYVLNPIDGHELLARPISPPTMAALGDFNPLNHLYYGLEFTAFDATAPTSIIVVDPIKGTATRLGVTVQDLHVLAFVK